MIYGASVMYQHFCEKILETGQSWDIIPNSHDSRDLFLTMGMREWRDKGSVKDYAQIGLQSLRE
jgi:hypothetical protein